MRHHEVHFFLMGRMLALTSGFLPHSLAVRPRHILLVRMKEQSLTKLLVRRVGSNRFLKCTGRWSKSAREACNFPNLLNALNACLANGLKEVELVLRYKGDSDDRCYRVRCT